MASKRLDVSKLVAKQIDAIAKKMGNGSVSIGFLENAIYPDGTPVASVAWWNIMGHGGPFPSKPRPFFQNMIAKESPSWPGTMATLAIKTKNNGPLVLAAMGDDIQQALIKSITDFNSVPLSPTTLLLRKRFGNSPEKITLADVRQAQRDAAKGATGAAGTQAKQLVWTGFMQNHTGYEVKK